MSTMLSKSHYAGRWVITQEDQHYDLKTVNLLGYEYATSEDSALKEQKLLKVLENFHGYLSKYLIMIIRWTIPPAASRAGKDAKELLRTLAPRGSKPGPQLTNDTCKMLHFAFKGDTTEEIYDTLAFCFMRAARKYDPYYADKTKQVCEVLNELPKQFTQQEVEARVGFDCTGILRSLVRKSYLASVTGKKKKVVGYTVGKLWPAPASFFASDPIGFVYVLQMWFRYYFNEYVVGKMAELETKDGVFQLAAPGGPDDGQHSQYREILHPHADGNCVTSDGSSRFMADRTLLAWVS